MTKNGQILSYSRCFNFLIFPFQFTVLLHTIIASVMSFVDVILKLDFHMLRMCPASIDKKSSTKRSSSGQKARNYISC